ncbi:MAG: 16S rRNA processing protein RimM [Deltaproteobacteria bacterium]|nr:16S rRNA processing protein RimM [Deltaproteobacteria bacterium]
MEKIAVGYVARAHGIKGEIRVHLYDEFSQALVETPTVIIAGVERRIRSIRRSTGGLLVSLEDLGDRSAAEALKGAEVEVPRSSIPMAEDEFFLSDMVGCEVVDEHGTSLGRAVEVVLGPQDLLVIHDDRGERLLPIVPEFIVSVDVAGRRVVVSPPEGLPMEPISGRKR